jgi:hypothetical protein
MATVGAVESFDFFHLSSAILTTLYNVYFLLRLLVLPHWTRHNNNNHSLQLIPINSKELLKTTNNKIRGVLLIQINNKSKLDSNKRNNVLDHPINYCISIIRINQSISQSVSQSTKIKIMSAARQLSESSALVSDGPNYLHSKWTMWFDNPRFANPEIEWKDNLTNCGTFDTIEDFWRIYNNLKPASTLSVNSNYHVFREGIVPMWEDLNNKVRAS